MNLRFIHAGLILCSAALAVLFGLWSLGVAGLGNGARKPSRGHRGFRRGGRPGRVRLVVPEEDEDAAMIPAFAATLLRRGRLMRVVTIAIAVMIVGSFERLRLPGVLRGGRDLDD